MILFSSVVNLVFEPPEHHGLIHSLARINPLDDQMAKGIGNIDQASPGVSPLKSSPKVKGMLRFFENGKKDEDRSISQKKSRHKNRRKDPS
jgi:hypothetical protein